MPRATDQAGEKTIRLDQPAAPAEDEPAQVEKTRGPSPMAAWFLGPKAEHRNSWGSLLQYIFDDYVHWRRNYFPDDPIVISRKRLRDHELWLDELNGRLDEILNELKAHFPFYSPRYLAHMLSEQTLPSVLGYFAGMLYNPNNVTEEAAPVTVDLELDVGRMVSAMLGFNPRTSWAHITSGGTIANLEALWVARSVQLSVFSLRELCGEMRCDFSVKTADKTVQSLADLDDATLLALPPNEAIYMPRKLGEYLVKDRGMAASRAGAKVQAALQEGDYSVRRAGVARVLSKIGKRPLVMVSSAAHYSIKKACDALGYGEDAVQLLPVTSDFRMDVDALEDCLRSRPSDTYVAAVVGIVGTTEEGAVDPIHQLHFLRGRLAEETNTSFWLHADAAWAGYVASLFRGHPSPRRREHRDWKELTQEYVEMIAAREDFETEMRGPTRSSGRTQRDQKKSTITWGNRDVYAAYLALGNCDSITVDPHKMGYVPYPAGVIAFKNGVLTELLAQKANYISEYAEGLRKVDDPAQPTAVGPYILEGSKPGAAASACWLAHKTIPLVATGHGKIVRTTLLNAQKLHRYLQLHRRLYFRLEEELGPGGKGEDGRAFTFFPLYEPDTNIVCYIARPMGISNDRLVDVDCSLKMINALGRELYQDLGRPPNEFRGKGPYGHPYFISRTFLEHEQYSAQSMRSVLKKLGIKPVDYRRQGLFVMRSTVMNPHYHLAAEDDGEGPRKDYLMDFLRHLHRRTRDVLDSVVAT